ncbi:MULTISPECIES: MFS transporter [unclassified Streptomyces]|uniref:MFS transporter n=1 Tax=unclassified Streptomyces TaxID=2593676 RepID=UPI0018F896B7|nr:MFS transporter [Streptomyces sp. HmicA12]
MADPHHARRCHVHDRLDCSIVMVALPEIGRDLSFGSASALQWVATACLLPTAGLLPLFGRLSDLLGRRRLFVLGAFLFTALSLVAAAAVSPGMLIAARAGQGIAAAMIAPTALALMTSLFPEGPRRTRALAVNGALLSLGFVVGTIRGGVITNGLNWRWTMALLVTLGSVVLTGALAVLPRHGDVRRANRLDVPGAVLAAVAASTGGSVLAGLQHAFLTAGLVTAAALPVTAVFLRRR